MEQTTSSDITYEDFAKIDLRAGTIVSAETIQKSKKLLKLEVDFGAEIGKRQILAGIRSSCPVNEDGTPDTSSLVGFQAMFVVNIAPRGMMGMMSHGMILAAISESGDVIVSGSSGGILHNGAKFG